MTSPSPRQPPDFEAGLATNRSHEWATLLPGFTLTVVKLAPNGAEAARYPGEVVAVAAPPPWVIVRAIWANRTLEVGGLRFRREDILLEWFSPADWFNVFAVLSPRGHLRGWYANVTYPARLDLGIEPPLLTWHDLYVDLVGLPDGSFTIRDEDELAASGLRQRHPALHARIVATRRELVRRVECGLPPFLLATDQDILRTLAGTADLGLGTTRA